MPLSDLISFSLKLKGRGHFLSPKEIKFLKDLLAKFEEEEIKAILERCFKEVIPPDRREKTPLNFCSKLFRERETNVYNKRDNWKNTALREILKELSPPQRRAVLAELKRFFADRKPSKEELETVLKLILRKYL
jgi:hypothetical protein